MSEAPEPQDPQEQFELTEFEQVEAAPGTRLLRLSGRPRAPMPTGGLTLVIGVGGETHRHEQLPALPGPPGLVRATFSVPHEQLDGDVSFRLELSDGRSLALPAPASRGPALGGGGPTSSALLPALRTGAGPGAAAEASRLLEAERLAESRRLAVSELERRLQGERERRAAAEGELTTLRGERDQARADRDAAMAEREAAVADRDQAEARARAAAASAGALEAQLRAAADAATRTQVTLEAQLSDRVAELERVRAVAEAAQARAHASRREATELDERLAHAQAQITVLQQTLDEREAEHGSARLATDEELAAARSELTGARERVSGLEAEIQALRQRGARNDAAHVHEIESAQARIQSLQAAADEAQATAQAARRRGAELESTLAELDAALAARAAEIELLRAAVLAGAGVTPIGGATNGRVQGELPLGDASAVLAAEVDLLRAQLSEHREQAQRAQGQARAALARARAAEEALVATTAQSALTREALALEAARPRG